MSPSLTAGLIVVLIGSTLVSFGYLKAVMDRANTDYKESKGKLPSMRKAYWNAWWGAVKVGFWVFIAALFLLAWMVHEVRGAAMESHPERIGRGDVVRTMGQQ